MRITKYSKIAFMFKVSIWLEYLIKCLNYKMECMDNFVTWLSESFYLDIIKIFVSSG